jgi:ABC-type sugar transport system ATPase subunit
VNANSTSQPTDVIYLAGVSKRYGGTYAVQDVSFSVKPGEIHAVLGENGAGKSTLMKVISGAVKPDEGTILVDGIEHVFAQPSDASAAGIAMVYQESSLVESMTVAQNLFLGQEKAMNNLSHLNSQAREILESHNFHISPDAVVGSLGIAQKSMVEIARGIHRKARLVILDEPTASVTPEERLQLYLSMRRLKRDGLGIIFITHMLDEALSEADRITVLRDGVVQGTLERDEFDRDRVVRMMVGRDVAYTRHPAVRQPDPTPVLEVEDLTLLPMVRNMSFSAYPGEIMGIYGLVGAGRSEVSHIISGLSKRRRLRGGIVRLNGREVRYRTPRQARRDGIVYVTEDRKRNGFFSHLSIAENIFLGDLSSARRLRAFVSGKSVARVGREYTARYQVKALNPERAKMEELSGGNQQKVVLAKSLTRKPLVAILDEPTRGVDVGAIAEIHALVRSLAEDGVAVIVISSYLPEIEALADRILVARQGSIAAEFNPSEVDEESLMFAAVH